MADTTEQTVETSQNGLMDFNWDESGADSFFGLNEFGEVLSVGPGAYSQMGNLIPTQLKPGDKVILPTMGFTKFDYDGETFYVGREAEVLSKIKD